MFSRHPDAIEAKVDELIDLAQRLRNAEIDAGTCGTPEDHKKLRKARGALQSARDDFRVWLRGGQ